MDGLKKLGPESIDRALGAAEHYRLLCEPREVESICSDVLSVDPENQAAVILLLLSLTDQFQQDMSRVADAKALVGRITGSYEQSYYSGIIAERVGKAQLVRSGPSSGSYANRALREAMVWFEKAEAIRPPGNDGAILRWNTCVRLLERHGLVAESLEPVATPLTLE